MIMTQDYGSGTHNELLYQLNLSSDLSNFLEAYKTLHVLAYSFVYPCGKFLKFTFFLKLPVFLLFSSKEPKCSIC